MAGSKADFKGIFPYFNKIPFLQINQGAIIIVKWKLPALPWQGRKIQDGLFLFMDMQVQSPGIMYEFVPENMVQVTVGVQQQNRGEPGFLYARF